MSKYYMDTDTTFPTRDMEGERFAVFVDGEVRACIFTGVTCAPCDMAESIKKQIKGVDAIGENGVLRLICDKPFVISETPSGLTWATFRPLKMEKKPKTRARKAKPAKTEED